MPDNNLPTDLFALGQKYFNDFMAEFASYGLQADPGIELRKGSGLLCYYSLEERHIYLSVPDLSGPMGKLQALFLRSLLGCDSNDELLRFLQLILRHVIAHELAHHYRHRYGRFGDSLWQEEQLANKLAVAVVKHRLSPEEKEYAKKFLRRAIETLSAKMQAKNITVDSYYSVLDALNVSGQLDTVEFENLELIKNLFKADAVEMLVGSGQLSNELVERLEERDDLIEAIDESYASDQIKYIYYHVGWLYLDLTSRETEYVDEFARLYLGLGADLLPLIEVDPPVSHEAVLACFKAYQDTAPFSEAVAHYFYKRYRSLLLAKLKSAKLHDVSVQTERLKREATLILENWQEGHADTLDFLAQLAPSTLRPLFPHLIATQLKPQFDPLAYLPAPADCRLWQYVIQQSDDQAAVNTLRRLELLDRSAIYNPLPAEVLLELAHHFSLVKYAPGETVIWQGERNDDVYFLIEGQLEVLVTQAGQTTAVGLIQPGEIFGEIAFFTEDARYATVRAVEPSQCFVLTDVDLQLLAYNHPAILMQMAGTLAKRLADQYQTSRKETV